MNVDKNQAKACRGDVNCLLKSCKNPYDAQSQTRNLMELKVRSSSLKCDSVADSYTGGEYLK